MLDLKQQFVTVAEVMESLDMGKTKAREIIRNLNKELEADGFRTIKGKVPRSYFYKRYALDTN